MANNQQLLLGEGAGSAPAVFVEDVFSTYLYTGTGANQTITNGIDLATKGGMVWLKQRTIPTGTGQNFLFDSARGHSSGSAGLGYSRLSSDTTGAEGTNAQILAYPFNSNGFSLLADSGGWGPNQNTSSCVSWTFREQPKFFDIVTYTGDGTSNRAISHALTSTPGCIIVKRTDTTSAWYVYHRAVDASFAQGYYLRLNTTDARAGAPAVWDVAPTSANFTVQPSINVSAGTYVAYLFAHDAGGFGLAATDNVISCGSYTGNGSSTGPTVTLGYEPQWVMVKRTDSTGDWLMLDIMRGIPNTPGVAAGSAYLFANSSNAEDSAFAPFAALSATGFSLLTSNAQINASGGTYIYIAIRRGPMKVPTVGTSVFSPLARTGTGTNPTVVTTNTNPDLLMSFTRTAAPAAYGTVFFDKLRGVSQILQSANTNAEATTFGTFCLQSFLNTGFQTGADFIEGYLNYSGSTYAQYSITRAPGFFDEVCDTGTGAAHTITHNLGVPAELFIRKMRSGLSNWWCYNSIVGGTKSIKLNDSGTYNTSVVYWNDTDPTSTTFSVGTTAEVNQSGSTFVTYLFATCAGVSKVGGYTGNGSSQTIACGFAAGSRFVMIKRTDSTGDWYVWDSARGIIAGNDPHLSLNTTVAEVTTDDSVDTDNSGFIVNQLSATNVNVTSATYIFLAIA